MIGEGETYQQEKERQEPCKCIGIVLEYIEKDGKRYCIKCGGEI